ncbi:hypothetical protein HK405_010675 [Cladochytrium tenue]|nr:hypothetical protein HK405_010675 [Cladochytrium tenue]
MVLEIVFHLLLPDLREAQLGPGDNDCKPRVVAEKSPSCFAVGEAFEDGLLLIRQPDGGAPVAVEAHSGLGLGQAARDVLPRWVKV